MNKTHFLLTALIISGFIAKAIGESNTQELAEDSETKAMKTTILKYFEGRKNSDIEMLKQTFSASARLMTLSDKGSIRIISLREYFEVVEKQGEVSATTTINHLYRDQTMGFAKVTFQYSDRSYIDHLELLNENGRWKIVNKTFIKN